MVHGIEQTYMEVGKMDIVITRVWLYNHSQGRIPKPICRWFESQFNPLQEDLIGAQWHVTSNQRMMAGWHAFMY